MPKPFQSLSLSESLLALLFVFLCILRVLFPDFTPFINDEAQLQLRINEFLRGGPLPLFGLSGSQPIPYGPVPTWIYSGLRMVWDNHTILVIGHTLLHLTALSLFAVTMLRLFNRLTALLVLVLVASSPYLFNYSRLPWDNTFLFLFSTSMVYCTLRLIQTSDLHRITLRDCWLWLVLGTSSGLALGTHLMVLPLVFASFAALTLVLGWRPLCEIARTGMGPLGSASMLACKDAATSAKTQKSVTSNLRLKPTLLGLGLSGLAMLVVLAPYIMAILPFVGLGQASEKWSALNRFDSMLSRLVASVSFPGFVEYFFRGDEAAIRDALTGRLRSIARTDWTWLLKGSILATLSLPVVMLAFGRWRRLSQLPFPLLYASFTTVLVLVFYAYAGHFQHPHYYNYVWWVPFFALGYALSLPWKRLTRVLAAMTLVVALLNIEFVTLTARFIAANEGVRSLGWGATAGNQKRLLRELCEDARQRGLNSAKVSVGQVVILPISLQFLASREPACEGLELGFGEDAHYVLHYPQGQTGPLSHLLFTFRR